jgi:alpha-D-ribose 1-methylphosphonate 5-triphosphate synthase subunit PhnH
MDLMRAPDLAIDGWVRYVYAATSELSPTHPVDERMCLALAGEDLPGWLEDGIRNRLIAGRGEALVAQTVRRAEPRG